MGRHVRAVRTSGVVLAASMGVLGLGAPAFAVAGGAPAANGTYGFTARLEMGSAACSGALVDASWVLTAATCFVQDGKPAPAGKPPQPTSVTVGRTDLSTDAGHAVSAVEIVPKADRNLALVRLSEPVNDIAPVRFASTPVKQSDTLRVAGYGRTKTEWVPDKLQTAQFTVSGVAASTFDILGKDGPAAAATCKGDAGGPALRENGDAVELVGVNTTSRQQGCLGQPDGTQYGATEARVDDIAGWFGDTVTCGSTEPGFAPLYDGRSKQTQAWRAVSTTEPKKVGCAISAGVTSGVLMYGAETLPKDYTLRVDWKALTPTAAAGVFFGFRYPVAKTGSIPIPPDHARTGVEVDIDLAGKKTGAVNGRAAVANAERAVGQWNTFDIAVTGRHIVVKLNGTQVNDVTENDPNRLIGAQFLGLGGSPDDGEVQYRNVRLRADTPAARFGNIGGTDNKCMGLNGDKAADGVLFGLVDCANVGSQQFTILPDSTIRVMGKCLDAAGPNKQVWLYTCNNTNAQWWTRGENSTLIAAGAPEKVCLDYSGGNNPLYTFPCHGRTNQQWKLPTAPARWGPIVGTDGKCMDVNGGQDTLGSMIGLFQCHGGVNQQFTVAPDSTLRVMSGCADSGATNNQVWLYTCNNTIAQWWTRDDAAATFQAPGSGNTKCLDYSGNNNPLYLFPCHGRVNQQWAIPMVGKLD
jgi:hypothetical protein